MPDHVNLFLQHLLDLADPPTAILTSSDPVAFRVMDLLRERNLDIPSDMSVVGFDDIQIAKYMQPSLSTVGASRFSWGSEAATQLIDFLENENPFHEHRIRTGLIQRESSTKNRNAPPTK